MFKGGWEKNERLSIPMATASPSSLVMPMTVTSGQPERFKRENEINLNEIVTHNLCSCRGGEGVATLLRDVENARNAQSFTIFHNSHSQRFLV